MRDQLKHFAVVAVLLATTCAANRNAFAQERTLVALADKAQRSIVYIRFDVTDPKTGAKSTLQGTGFIVSRSGYVLTASHLFRDWGKQTDVDKKQNLIWCSLRDKPGYVLESPLIMRIVNLGNPESEDVALLKLPDLAQGYTPVSVCLREASDAALGENFVAFGFPLDQNFQPVQGILGTTNAPGGRWAAAAPFTYGMSGGPVYTNRGFILGIIKGGLEADAVSWITPIQLAIGLLTQAGYQEDCAGPRIIKQPPTVPSAYGLTFEKTVWKHRYLDANGDYQGEQEYFVKNTSDVNIKKLPPCELTWFGSLVEPPEMRLELYDEGKNAYSLEKKQSSCSPDYRSDIDGRNRKVTACLWQFDISPVLAPQKSLHYAMITKTKGTEREAFTSDGSFAGMLSTSPVGELNCELYAPKGYRFKKPLAYFVKDRAGIMMKDSAEVSKPEFKDNDTKVIWSVENPTPNLQYLIRVVIDKAN